VTTSADLSRGQSLWDDPICLNRLHSCFLFALFVSPQRGYWSSPHPSPLFCAWLLARLANSSTSCRLVTIDHPAAYQERIM
jgi:hypothetical protein